MSVDDAERLRWHTTDYNARDDGRNRARILRGFWLDGVPRLMLRCRLSGHDPVVAGTPDRGDRVGYRWVECRRCKVRPEPQGNLDPARWAIGQRYTGARGITSPHDTLRTAYADPETSHPGAWPTSPRGTVGGELVVAGGSASVSAEVGIGHAGDEQTFSGHLHLGKLAALYLHLDRHGSGLRERLNPTRHDRTMPYESRSVGVAVHDSTVWWKLWAPDGSWSRDDPRWWQGHFAIDPRDLLLGKRRGYFDNVGAPVDTTIRCAHGDDHPVALQLQRWCEGRPKSSRRRNYRWSADVRAGRAISTRSDNDWKDGLVGWHVDLSGHGLDDGSWVQEAADRAAAVVSADRARSIYQHSTGLPA